MTHLNDIKDHKAMVEQEIRNNIKRIERLQREISDMTVDVWPSGTAVLAAERLAVEAVHLVGALTACESLTDLEEQLENKVKEELPGT